MPTPYNFQPQAPAPTYDVERLKRALQQSAEGTQGLEHLAPQMETARALRDTPYAKGNVHGYISPYMSVANAMKRNHGTTNVRAGLEMEAAHRAKIAEGAGQESLFTLYNKQKEEERAAKKELLEIRQHNLGENRALIGDEYKVTEEKRKVDKHGWEGDAEERKAAEEKRKVDEHGWARTDHNALGGANEGEYERIGPDGKPQYLTVYEDKYGKPVDQYGKPVDLSSWKRRVTSSNRKPAKAWTYTQTSEYAKAATQARNIQQVVDNWKPAYAKAGGLDTKFLNDVLHGATGADLTKYFDEETDAAVKESLHWWADWAKLYTLPERYDAFGATLTYNELQSWRGAEAVFKGGDPVLIEQRINRLNEIMRDAFMRMSNLQLSTIPEHQRDVILKGVEGMGGTYDAKTNTLSWGTGSTGSNEEGVVDDDVVIPVPQGVGEEVWAQVSKADKVAMKGLSEAEIIEILTEEGLMGGVVEPAGKLPKTMKVPHLGNAF